MKATIAWKPIGDINLPSSRLRAFLPCQYLQKKGYACEIFRTENIRNYQLVIFQKTYTHEDIQLAHQLNKQGCITVFDLCDNHFYIPVEDDYFKERAERLSRMVETVKHVTVSTQELGRLIKNKTATIIDDFIETPQLNLIPAIYYSIRKKIDAVFNKHLKIVWYGSAGSEHPQFGMIDLKMLIPILEKINQTHKISLTVISSSEKLFKEYLGNVSFKTTYHTWKKKTFPYLLKQNDICILPVNKNPFTICKTNNRLVLSLLLGVPVIADRIPSYEEFSDYVLFSDWENNLLRYMNDQGVIDQHLKEGITYIENKYSTHNILKEWEDFLNNLLTRKNA